MDGTGGASVLGAWQTPLAWQTASGYHATRTWFSSAWRARCMSQSRFSRRTRKSPSPQDNPSPAVPWLRRRWLLGGVGSILVIVMTGMLLYYPPWSNGV